MIILKNVVKNYKTKKSTFNALNNVSLTLPDNGLFFVTGNSGAGKSTLLNVIGSIDTIDSGEINIDGINLSKTTKKQINNYRQNFIGFVFQQFNLINELTVYENVIVAADLSNNEYSNIDELLQSLNIYDLKNKNNKEGNLEAKFSKTKMLLGWDPENNNKKDTYLPNWDFLNFTYEN